MEEWLLDYGAAVNALLALLLVVTFASSWKWKRFFLFAEGAVLGIVLTIQAAGSL